MFNKKMVLKPGDVGIKLEYRMYKTEDEFHYGAEKYDRATYTGLLKEHVWLDSIDKYMAIHTNKGTFFIDFEEKDEETMEYIQHRINKHKDSCHSLKVYILIEIVKDVIREINFIFFSTDKTHTESDVIIKCNAKIKHEDTVDANKKRIKLVLREIGKFRDRITLNDKVTTDDIDRMVDFLLRMRHLIERR